MGIDEKSVPHTGDFDIQMYVHVQMHMIKHNKLAIPTLLAEMQLPCGCTENLVVTKEVLVHVGIHSHVVRFADGNIHAAFLDISQVGAPCPMVGCMGLLTERVRGC